MPHTEKPPVTVAEYIRQLREARGMSIADLQRALGVAWSTVNNWEKRGAVPEPITAKMIVDKLGLSAEEEQGLREAMAYVPPSAVTSAPASPRTAGGAARPPSTAPNAGRSERNEAMSDALTRALDTSRHTLMDGLHILEALASAGDAFTGIADPNFAARAWLDAAVVLRSRGLPITAANLVVVLPEAIRGGSDVSSADNRV